MKKVEELMKRVNVNDTSAMCNLANYYNNGQFFSAGSCKSKSNSETGRGTWSNRAHCRLGHEYHKGGDLKKAKFHWK